MCKEYLKAMALGVQIKNRQDYFLLDKPILPKLPSPPFGIIDPVIPPAKLLHVEFIGGFFPTSHC